ncbi:MAG TPA: hypothetical protein VGQ59_12235 [Cyclobacteriaceae bacterium]|jgi:hypothetical protein|nr:hypothetical protein [Cyclobacteriaceae bacterium]
MAVPSAPRRPVWMIGMACGIGGIIGHYVHVQILTPYNYLLLLIGFIILAVSTTIKL